MDEQQNSQMPQTPPPPQGAPAQNQQSMSQTNQMSRDEQVGFHKGALSTLAKERSEMAKILNIVEQLMQMHVQSLKQLGIDLEAQAQQAVNAQQSAGQPAQNKPIEDILNKPM